MLYQRVNVPTGETIGEPGPLPDAVDGVSDAFLADLDAHFDVNSLAELGLLHAGFIPVEPPPPPVEHKVTRIAFMQRIPAAKRIPIRVAAKTDPVIEDFLDLLMATDIVDLSNADTLMGLGYLQMHGLLSQEDVEAILA